MRITMDMRRSISDRELNAPESFDINRIKMHTEQLDSRTFELSIYLYSPYEYQLKLDEILNFIQKKYYYGYNAAHMDYNHISMKVDVLSIRFIVELLSDILYNTKDKTTQIYNKTHEYIKRLTELMYYGGINYTMPILLNYNDYSYLNKIFNIDKEIDNMTKPQLQYEDIENAIAEKPFRIIETRQEAMDLLNNVTSYFKSIIDYCEEHFTHTEVITTTLPYFKENCLHLIRVEIISSKLINSCAPSNASTVKVYVDNIFVIGREYNIQCQTDITQPFYKLTVSYELK